MKRNVYLDNAATTALDKQVLEEMMPYLTEHYGNPSSIHAYGRKAKSAIEKARKVVAKYLNASTSEIFFTGSGTESNNTIIKCSVRDLGVKRIISSRIEHHCVLHSVEAMGHAGVQVEYVNLDSQGHADLAHLEELLKASDVKTLVSLMHSNNEIGTLLDIDRVAEMCKQYNAYFHSDTVQTIGYFSIDVQKTRLHFLSGSAHKFHGPKGIGFLYVSSEAPIKPFIDGGSQERNMRAGTENVAGIVGLGKALELALEQMQTNREYIMGLKDYMLTKLQGEIEGIEFNGDITATGSNYKVLSVSLPPNEKAELTLFNLDMAGIAASGGSACTSGSEKGSHVLEGIHANPDRKAVRFSFSKYTTRDEIDYAVEVLKGMLKPVTVKH
ncbi:MAG TPA: cysteine desulfurase family protein [Chitinophagales bacterium]|nr:cysteine desulfurase family protein [Chitinophagales bacterium]